MPTEFEIDEASGVKASVCEPVEVVRSDLCITRKSTWATHASDNNALNCNSHKSVSLASIMKDEERATVQRKKEEKTKSDRLEPREDDNLLKIALEASLAEESLKDDKFEEEMRKALSLSMEESQPIAAVAGTNKSEEIGLSPEEQAEIEEALRVADEEATTKSIQLALHLQAEEEKHARRFPIHKTQGHVRLMTRSELWQEQCSQESTRPRQLFDAEYSFMEGEELQQDQGYRINSTNGSGSWSRANGSTIVGPNNELRTKHDVSDFRRTRSLQFSYASQLTSSVLSFP